MLGRRQRLAPARRDRARRGDGWTIADLGSTNGVRVNGRAASTSAHGARSPATGSRSAPSTRASRSSDARRRRRAGLRRPASSASSPSSTCSCCGSSRSALKDLRRPPRRAVPPAATASPTDATGLHPASQAGAPTGAFEPRLIVERAPGHTPGMEYDVGDGAVHRPRRPGRDPPRGPVRVLAPRAGSRARAAIVVLEDLGSTNGTYLNEELLDGPAAAAPRRPHPHRRQRVHLRGPLMLRVAEHFERTDTGRQRRGNEDAFYARAPLFAVADGMGGAQAGEVASHLAVEVARAGPARRRRARPRSACARASREANARIHAQSAQADDARAGMGTTLTAAYVGEDDLTVAHVGDSRAYRLRDGELRAADRRPLARRGARAPGKLTPEEADEHPQRSIITRALGPEDGRRGRQHARGRRATATSTCSAGRPDVDDPRGATSRRSCARRRRWRSAGARAHRRGQRRRRARQHHRRPVPPRGGRRRASADAGSRRASARPARDAPRRRAPTTAAARRRPTAPVARRSRAAARRAPPARRHAAPPPRASPVGRDPRRLLVVACVPSRRRRTIASQTVYFVGTSDDGFVTRLPRPALRPAGRAATSTRPTTSRASPRRRAARRRQQRTVLDHKLRSRDDAQRPRPPARARAAGRAMKRAQPRAARR